MPCLKETRSSGYIRPQPSIPQPQKPVLESKPPDPIPTRPPQVLKTEEGSYDSPHLTITLGPGVVRYLSPRDLIQDSGRLAIEEIESFGLKPTIKFPYSYKDFCPESFGIPDKPGSWDLKFKFEEFPPLFEDRPYPQIIRDLAEVIAAYCQDPFPSEAYWAFHQFTESGTIVLREFFQSWMRETFQNHDLTQSYSESEHHQLLTVGHSSTYVFRKTRYLRERRQMIECAALAIIEEEERRQAEEAAKRFDDAILRSSYDVFTYLMEDTRNGLMKIGKSKNPERREKTLQSEAPTVELRIAVPTESDFEYELHGDFAHLRRRGEWFELSSSDIKAVIEQLLENGDPKRAITSNDWLGAIFLASFDGDDASQKPRAESGRR